MLLCDMGRKKSGENSEEAVVAREYSVKLWFRGKAL
jgi:hypothetical protein